VRVRPSAVGACAAVQEGPSAEEVKATAEAERKLKEHAEAFLGVVSDSLTCLLAHLACACT
jgi:hypothetical protein